MVLERLTRIATVVGCIAAGAAGLWSLSVDQTHAAPAFLWLVWIAVLALGVAGLAAEVAVPLWNKNHVLHGLRTRGRKLLVDIAYVKHQADPGWIERWRHQARDWLWDCDEAVSRRGSLATASMSYVIQGHVDILRPTLFEADLRNRLALTLVVLDGFIAGHTEDAVWTDVRNKGGMEPLIPSRIGRQRRDNG